MIVEHIDNPQDLRSLVGPWNALGPQSPMMTSTWLIPWWDQYGIASACKRLYVLGVYDLNRQLVGLAPWFVEADRFGKRVIRFLGSGKVCSDHLTILCLPGLEHDVGDAIANWLLERPRPEWTEIDLDGVDQDDVAINAFVQCMREKGESLINLRNETNSWMINLPATWDDYLESLTKNRRKRLRRWQRNYFDTGRARYFVAENQDELANGINILEKLHNLRRRSVGEVGAFEDEDFRKLHYRLLPQLLRRDMLRLAWLELDGSPVAAEYQIRHNNVIYAYQSGIDPRQAADSPGGLSIMASIRQAIETGCNGFDLLRGDEQYKSSWGALVKPAFGVRVRRRNLHGRIRHAADSMKEHAKKFFDAGKKLVSCQSGEEIVPNL